MALVHSPKIVTDNLLFYVDAANAKSYPGTGTTWTDMMGTNNGTIDGATFNTNVFDFDGTDDKVELGSIDSSNVLSLNDPAGGGLTISTAINWTLAGIDDFPRIINRASGSNGKNGWGIHIHKNSSSNTARIRFCADTWCQSSDTYSQPATWEIWTFTHVNATGGAWAWYLNGIIDKSGNNDYSIPTDETDAQIGRAWQPNKKRYKGKIPFVMVYDRALSAAEVKQNFDALKGRFGL